MLKAHTAEPGMLKKKRETHEKGAGDLDQPCFQQGTQSTSVRVWDLLLPVELCGEHPDHGRDTVDLDYVCNGLQNIKVEKRISRDRTVKPSLQKGSPVFLQNSLRAPHVILTYAGHAGIDSLPRDKTQAME